MYRISLDEVVCVCVCACACACVCFLSFLRTHLKLLKKLKTFVVKRLIATFKSETSFSLYVCHERKKLILAVADLATSAHKNLLFLSCIYIYIYIHTHTHTHTHIYIYIERERERERKTISCT